MSEPGGTSWDEMVERLRRVAAEVRTAATREGNSDPDEVEAATRLKGDVSRLERSASEVLSRLSAEVEERRMEIQTSFDRERAERNAVQLKSSLEDLAALGASLASGIASAASSSLKQAEPELKTAASALEDVAGSAAAWMRSIVDPGEADPRNRASDASPPLDDL